MTFGAYGLWAVIALPNTLTQPVFNVEISRMVKEIRNFCYVFRLNELDLGFLIICESSNKKFQLIVPSQLQVLR
eukprot:GAHX01002876.1.p2 GENE.GAHX01002876.1~~GAHX01002876.1.p2  ORF type:complete len:74 (+),score=0.09 GAHX01002876.1:731-952(+)